MSSYERLSLLLQTLIFSAAVFVGYIYWGQWGTMEQTFEASQRAWIVLENLYLTSHVNLSPAKATEITLEFQNAGRSPAVNLHVLTRYEFRARSDQIAKEEDIHFDREIVSGSQSVAGGHPWKTFLTIPPQCEDTISAYRKGDILLNVYGYITYTDGFPRMRETRFCMTQIPPDKSPNEVRFLCCPFHNDVR